MLKSAGAKSWLCNEKLSQTGSWWCAISRVNSPYGVLFFAHFYMLISSTYCFRARCQNTNAVEVHELPASDVPFDMSLMHTRYRAGVAWQCLTYVPHTPAKLIFQFLAYLEFLVNRKTSPKLYKPF